MTTSNPTHSHKAILCTYICSNIQIQSIFLHNILTNSTLTHQGSHAFHKNRRKGKRNLPLADRFVKPSKSASWFVRIFKGAAFLKSDHPLQVSTHEQIINDLLNASSGSSSQNEIRVFSFSLFWLVLCLKDNYSSIYICLTYIFI